MTDRIYPLNTHISAEGVKLSTHSVAMLAVEWRFGTEDPQFSRSYRDLLS